MKTPKKKGAGGKNGFFCFFMEKEKKRENLRKERRGK
jgi:hypothetical protein